MMSSCLWVQSRWRGCIQPHTWPRRGDHLATLKRTGGCGHLVASLASWLQPNIWGEGVGAHLTASLASQGQPFGHTCEARDGSHLVAPFPPGGDHLAAFQQVDESCLTLTLWASYRVSFAILAALLKVDEFCVTLTLRASHRVFFALPFDRDIHLRSQFTCFSKDWKG